MVNLFQDKTTTLRQENTANVVLTDFDHITYIAKKYRLLPNGLNWVNLHRWYLKKDYEYKQYYDKNKPV